MVKKLFYFSWVFLFSCRSAKDLIGFSKKDFIGEFKTLSFCRCMQNSMNNKYNLAEQDVSCRVPDFLNNQFSVIDSLGKQEAIKIKQDSVNRIGIVAEGMEGKVIFSNCLNFMNSNALKKIAIAQFKSELKTTRHYFK